MNSAIIVMQGMGAVMIVLGSILTLTYLARRESAANAGRGAGRFDYRTANDFEMDYRRVLAFSRLATR
jgi:hypothetical protein